MSYMPDILQTITAQLVEALKDHVTRKAPAGSVIADATLQFPGHHVHVTVSLNASEETRTTRTEWREFKG